MMQKVRLETKSHDLVKEIEMQLFSNGEPDAIVWGDRIFLRRPQLQTEPPKKNDPEVYFEAFAWSYAEEEVPAPAPKFDKVTETIPSTTKATEPPAASSKRKGSAE
jgi:hypothetical protein